MLLPATQSAYAQQCNDSIQQAQAQLQALENLQEAPRLDNVLEPLNRLGMLIDRAFNLAGLYQQVHPDAAIREAAQTCEQELSKVVVDIGLSKKLYTLLVDLHATPALQQADAITQRYVTRLLRDYKRAGVDKPEAVRQQIRAMQHELVEIGQTFSKHIREDVRYIELNSPALLAGLPDDYQQAHTADKNGVIRISTDYPDYLPFMNYAEDDHSRLLLYQAFNQRAYPKNVDVLDAMLAKREALAKLLGYADWATYITEDKMIKTPAAAANFIDRINQAATQRAGRDYDVLLKKLQSIQPQATAVGMWQKAYLQERIKRDDYKYDAQQARTYFLFSNVRQGLFDITSKMFDIVYRPVTTQTWHSSVEAYEVLDHGVVIGRFYLDLHPRANKYKHAAAFPIVSGVLHQQIPEAALVCNFPDTLLEHDDVQTFFHEFGHLLHHIFAGKQRFVAMSGISTEWDFVEAPSQMLEEWTFDHDTLKIFARNAQGALIPDSLIESMRHARDFGQGLWVKQQMLYAALSLQYHASSRDHISTDALLVRLQKKYSVFAPVPNTHFDMSFGHLEGYSAMYYTYMWSLVIAKDLFSQFVSNGLLNQQTAQHYRHTVLEPGGSKDAAVLVHDFLGRDTSFVAFSTWLDAH